MITEKDLQEAIAECEGQRNPNANTCIKLAAFYTIKQHLDAERSMEYSYSAGPLEGPNIVGYDSGTEFSDLSMGVDADKFMSVMDELMTTLSVVNPRLYSGVLRKLAE